ncbi:MAG: transposase [Sphingomonadales bacterium CG12_big_fil_rev_8_21_14_0_65_65_10]|nr:MAG: transposase [Sphingomonadales bacterium CG12_big_fil_rev_8_21_14_0_65_65_10]
MAGGADIAARTDAEETREWFGAAELAELGLPGLPGDKRMINRRAQDEMWAGRSGTDGRPLVRRRAGRGGGNEFHVTLLPSAARAELARRGLVASAQPEPTEDRGDWRWYEAQNRKVKSEAEHRLAIVREVEQAEQAGQSRSAAIEAVAATSGAGRSTIYSWFAMIEGVPRADRLPALAPRRKGGGAAAEIDTALWQLFASDYLRPSAPTLCSCYRRTAEKAKEMGIAIPGEQTFRRRLKKELHPDVIVLKRGGAEALERAKPAQRRTVDHLHALERVNIDGHRFDVFVDMGDGKPVRPTMVAIQDVYSSKLLAWRIDISESAVLTRLAFADLFRNFGIPKHCHLDNGRAFASKWITGGAKTRFRFKIRDEDPTGVLVGLGIGVHWARPHHGQSKPIERAFRDLCDDIAKHPAMEGAYTGNSPMAKPANYGSRAIPIAEFEAHVARGIAAHNARSGRRGRHYRGRSFDTIFAESYATAEIRKATPQMLRMALLTAEQKLVNSRTGEIELYGNRYWSPECSQLRGQRVTVRFDPEDLHSEIHLYGQDGAYLASVPLLADGRFDNVDDAKKQARRDAEHRQLVRQAALAEDLLTAREVAERQAEIESFEAPEPSVVRPVAHRGNVAAARKIAPERAEEEQRQSKIFGAVAKLRLVE